MENYATRIRRELHSRPGVGFDLDETLEIIRRELDSIGVAYTEKMGKSSVVATVNPEKTNYTLAIRADTDALPITEKNEVTYKSKNEGVMHACGHDAHTAIALDALRRINEMRDDIPLCVKFIFQSAEEYKTSGAKLLCDDGVMNGIDSIVALHCDPEIEVGKVAVSDGPQNSTSFGFYLSFFGKSAHAAKRELGIDAIKMAHEAYAKITDAVEKEIEDGERVIFHVGKIEGGTTNNIVASSCSMFSTLRTYSDEKSYELRAKMEEICEGIAKKHGGGFELVEVKFYPVINNDAKITDEVRRAMIETLGAESVLPRERDMVGEDFAYYARIAPACFFRLGTKNEEKGITSPLHSDTFDIDERALSIGSDVFVKIVLNKAKEFQL